MHLIVTYAQSSILLSCKHCSHPPLYSTMFLFTSVSRLNSGVSRPKTMRQTQRQTDKQTDSQTVKDNVHILIGELVLFSQWPNIENIIPSVVMLRTAGSSINIW